MTRIEEAIKSKNYILADKLILEQLKKLSYYLDVIDIMKEEENNPNHYDDYEE